MNILFARDFADVDGTYTLIARLAKKFSQLGHKIYYLHYDNDNNEIINSISANATLLSYNDLKTEFTLGRVMPSIDIIQPILGGDRLIEVFTTIAENWFPRAKIIIGIYHPRAFIDKSKFGLVPDSKLYIKLLNLLPKTNIIVMHETMVKQHESELKLDLSDAHLINLPVDIPNRPKIRTTINRLKIVSIGRIVGYKSYNKTILPTLATLRRDGHNFEYYIYGDGPDKEPLIRLVAELGLENHVHLMGTVNPSTLEDILCDAGLFVGVGTAVVQAAGWCVPSLIGIDSNQDDTSYGWIANVSNTLGDIMPDLPKYKFKYLLQEYLKLDEKQYTELCLGCYSSAKQNYSIDQIADQYIRVYEGSQKHLPFRMNRVSRIRLKLLRQLHKPFMKVNFNNK